MPSLSSTLTFAILFIACVYCADYEWISGKVIFESPSSWDGNGGVGTPGLASNGDKATIHRSGETLTLATTSPPFPPQIDLKNSATFVVSSLAPSFSTVDVTSAKITLNSDTTVDTLNLHSGSELNFGANGELTVASGASFSGGQLSGVSSDINLENGVILAASGNFPFSLHTFQAIGSSKIEISSATLNGATINGPGAVNVLSLGTFTVTSGSLNTPLSNSGTLNIRSSIGDGGDTFSTSGTNSIANIDSTSGTINLDFTAFSIGSPTSVTCRNNINFQSGTVDLSNTVNINGDVGCDVKMEVDQIDSPVSIVNSNLILTGGDRTVTSTINVSGSGTFQPPTGSTYSFTTGSLTLADSASFGGITPRLTISDTSSALNFDSAATLNVNLRTGTSSSGSLQVNNAGATLVIGSSAANIFNSKQWSFSQCQLTTVAVDWTINKEVTQGDCALVLSNDVVLKETLNINDALTVSDSLTSTEASSFINCQNSGSISVTGFLQSSSSFNMDSCTLSTSGTGSVDISGSPSWRASTINIDGDDSDIRDADIDLNTGSSFNWNSGDLDTNPQTKFDLSGSTLTISATGGVVIQGTVDLDSESTVQNNAPVTFTNGAFTSSGGSLDMNAGFTFGTGSAISVSGSVSHTAGTLRFNGGGTANIGGTWTSTGSQFKVDMPMTVAASSNIDIDGTFNLNDKLTVNTQANLHATGNSNINDDITVTGTSAVVELDNTSSDANLSGINGGRVIINSWSQNALNDANFAASNSGSVAFGSSGEDFESSVDLDSGFMDVLASESMRCDKCNIDLSNNSEIRILADATLNHARGTIGGDGKIFLSDGGTYASENNGNLLLDDDFTIEGSGKVSIQGSLGLEENGSIGLTGANSGFILKSGSSFSITESASISVVDGVVESNLNIKFEDSTSLEVGNLQNFDVRKIDFEDDSDFSAVGVSGTSTLLDGTINIHDSSSFSVIGSGTEFIVGPDGEVTMRDESEYFLSNNAKFTVEGEVYSYDENYLTVTLNSEIYMADGEWNFGPGIDKDSLVFMNVSNSDIVVDDGVINLEKHSWIQFSGDSTASLVNPLPVIGSQGVIVLNKGATVEIISPCTIIVSAPLWDRQGGDVSSDGSFDYPATDRSYTGPGCDIYRSSTPDSSVTFRDGSNFVIEREGCVIVEDSTLKITDSSFLVTDIGRLEVRRSAIELTGTSSFDSLLSGEFWLHSGSTFALEAPVIFANVYNASRADHIPILVQDSEITVQADVTFSVDTIGHISDDSVLNIPSGSLSVLGNSQLDMDNSTLTLSTNILVKSPVGLNVLNSVVDIAGSLNQEENGFSKFSGSTFTSGAGGSIILIQNSALEFTDLTVGTVGSGFSLADTASAKINNATATVTGSIGMTIGSSILADNEALLTVQSDVTMAGTSLIEVNNDSSMRFENMPTVTLSGDSTVQLTSDSSLLLASGTISLLGTSDLIALSKSNITIESAGDVEIQNTAKFQVSDSSLSLGSGSSVILRNQASFTLQNSSNGAIDGLVQLNNETSGLVSGSEATITGSLDLFGSSSFTVDTSGKANLLAGDVILNDNSDLFVLSAAEFNVEGTGQVNLNNFSNVGLESGSLYIDAEELSMNNESTLSVTQGGKLSVDGGFLNMNDESSISVTNGDIEVLQRDLNVYNSSSLDLTGSTSIISIAGGDILLANFASVDLTNSAQFLVTAGHSTCQNNATITLSSMSTFDLASTGGSSATFTDSCSIEVKTDATYSSSGPTTFDNDASYSLNSATFEVNAGNTVFRDNADGIIRNSGKFVIDGGNASFEDDADLDIAINSNFLVNLGNLDQRDTSDISISQTGKLTVLGSVSQFNNATISMSSSSTLRVDGASAVFTSNEYSQVNVAASSVVNIINNGGVTLKDSAEWNIVTSSISLSGGSASFKMESLSATNLLSSSFDVDGSVSLLGNSDIIANQTEITVSSGGFTAQENSAVSAVESSNFIINNGTVSFCDDASLFLDGSSSFIVNGGTVVFKNTSTITTEENSVIDVTGTFTIQNVVCPTFEGIFFTVYGFLNLRDDSCLTLRDSELKVLDGQLSTFDNHQLTVERSIVDLNIGSVSFSGSLSSFVRFTEVDFTLFEGIFRVSSFSSFTIEDSTVDIQEGQALFEDNTISTWDNSTLQIKAVSGIPAQLAFSDSASTFFVDSDISVVGGDVQILDNTVATITGTPFLVQSGTFGLSNFADVFFTNSPLDVDFGSILMNVNSSLLMTDSELNMNSVGGDFVAEDFACVTLLRSPVSVFGGSIDFNEDSCLKLTDSPILVDSGSVVFSHNSLLHLQTASSTLTVNSGNFELANSAEFVTSQGSQINIFGGNFLAGDLVELNFDSVDMFVGGNALFNNSVQLNLINSDIDIDGGFLSIMENVMMSVTQSNVTVTNGEFSTSQHVSLDFINSALSVGGDVNFDGSLLSTHNFVDSTIDVNTNGNLIVSSFAHLQSNNTHATISGGFFEMVDSSVFTSLGGSSLVLDGVGSLSIQDNSHVSVTDQSLISVVTEGASALFEDTAQLDISGASTFNVTGGNIHFADSAVFNLYEATNFNVLGGSFLLSGTSSMTAYPFTQGTIIGGDFFITDDACVTFIQSDIQIVGALSSNSTKPVQFLSNSTIVVNGAPVTISGTSVIHISSTTFLHVIDGSIVLLDTACILVNDTGRVLVSGGSILTYDHSCITVTNDASFSVTGGNVITHDFSTFSVSQNSIVTVAANGTIGNLKVLDDSYMEVIDSSTLAVIGGNFEVSDRAHFLSQSEVNITVFNGDVVVADYSVFDILEGVTLHVLDGGNFVSGGVGVQMNFDRSSTKIAGGDFVSSIRSSLIATNSDFEISANGNVLLTDISRTFFTESTTMNIFGGGNLNLFRSANLFLEDSSVSIDDAGSIVADSDSSLEMITNSSLEVTNGGSINFNEDSHLFALGNSAARVTGGGSIIFHDNASTVIKGKSEFTVSGSGSILFDGQSNADLFEFSSLSVANGGNIAFKDSSELHSIQSSLSVVGGNIIFTGSGVNQIESSSSLQVAGGNIEYRDTRVVNLLSSSLVVSSGNLQTFGSAVFVMSESSGRVSGGNFVLAESSFIDMQKGSSLDISSGNVELYNQGTLQMTEASISVTNSGTGSSVGHFSVSDFVSVQLTNSSIAVAGGSFENAGTSRIEILRSTISVSSGSFASSASSQFQVSIGSVEVSGGSLSLSGSSRWQTTNSETKVSGGDVSLSAASSMQIVDSLLAISEGNFNVLDSALLDIESSSWTLTGGDVAFSGVSSVFNGKTVEISISCGRILNDGNSQFIVSSSSILVNRESCGSEPTTKLPNPISPSDLIVIGGSAKFSSSAQTVVELLEGDFSFVESASSEMRETFIKIAGGNLNMKASSIHQLINSQISLSSGSMQISETAQVFVSNESFIEIDGGDLFSFGSIVFDLNSSSININSGSASFNGGTIRMESSSLQILGDSSSLTFAGSSQVSLSNSELSLTGSGIFEVLDNTQMEIVSSFLSVQEGNFRAAGNSLISVVSSEYLISGGDTSYLDNAQVIIENSRFQVSGGNVFFSQSSQFVLGENSVYSVTGGNVITSGSSTLNLNEACFVIEEGSVDYSESNSLHLLRSCWNVTGGNVLLHDNVEYTLGDNSVLRIDAGEFLAENFVNFSVDDSRVLVSGGSFTFSDSSSIVMRNQALIDVQDGNAVFSGEVGANVQDSTFQVSGGFVEFSGASNLDWQRSQLSVTGGDMKILGDSKVLFANSAVLVNGGSLLFDDTTQVEISSSSFDVLMGSVNFLGSTKVTLTDSSVSITEGDLQFGGESSVTFTNAPIQLSGQLEFLENASTHFLDSKLSIISGSFHAKDHANLLFERSSIDISGGSLHTQGFADVKIEDSRITINNGDFRVNDQGSFSMHRSSLVINTGNFVAHNPSSERKYVSITNSVVSVERENENSENVGHMELRENVELSLLSSDVVIDGDLILTGSAKLNVFEESSFTIPSGVVAMEKTSSIIVDGSSSVLNQGQLVAPGSIRVPGDSSMNNEGILESDHDFTANCFADLTAGAPLVNSGIFRMDSTDASHPLQSCVDNLQHSGLMQLGGTNITFNLVQTTSDSTITLRGSSVSLSSGPFQSEGNVGGTGNFGGSFVNNGDAVVMANGEEGATLLDVEQDFTSSGTMFFSINSRDLSAPGAITQVNAGRGVALEGGRACICINPSLDLEEGDQFDLVNAQNSLHGRFDSVEFECVECPRRSAKSVEGTKAGCEPSADYKPASFSVLFNGCDNDNGNYFDAVSPPWYVIFPVAVGIVIIIVVVFGGALTIDERLRKRKFEQKIARKRTARRQKLVKESQRSGASSGSSSVI